MRRIIVGLAVVGLTVALAGPAGAAAAPELKVSPRNHLTTQIVTVSWKHFRTPTRGDRDAMEINECSRALPESPTQSDVIEFCNTRTAQESEPGQATGSAQLTVVTGTIDPHGDTCGTSGEDRAGCEVIMWQIAGRSPAIARLAVVDITFEP